MKTATIVVDAGYGDGGKGKLVHSIAARTGAKLVVRYCGGAQAGHRVVMPDGREHVFSQFGSASFLPDVQTYLSKNMILHPLAMAVEEGHLATIGVTDAYERTLIDEEALVITPYHQAANRIREMARGQGRHGSCGMGISETVSDALAGRAVRAADLHDRNALERKMRLIGESKRAEIESLVGLLKSRGDAAQEITIFEDPALASYCADKMFELAKRMRIVSREQAFRLMNAVGDLVFEGSQGVLLDEWYGFFPYATRATTTAQKAHELLADCGFTGKIATVAVMRAYATRHGAGPFVTEDADLTARMPDACNAQGQWQGSFRIGWMDMLATRYALEAVGQVDELAITNLDRLEGCRTWKAAVGYRLSGSNPSPFFTHDTDGIARSIRFSAAHDLEYQRGITDGLMCAEPQYESLDLTGQPELDSRVIVAYIEQTLGVPVTFASFGPSTTDERILRPFSLAA